MQGEFKRLGKFPDRGVATREPGKDRPPCRICQRAEVESSKRSSPLLGIYLAVRLITNSAK
jgi:hypothetical protein